MTTPHATRTLRRVRAAILGWYAASHRDFPWRRTSDPYAVLVSEVMLQQTQASRVTDRFSRFMHRFPTAAALAAAPSSDVLAEWSGLGYNRRAVALQRTARAVVDHGWPDTVAGLESLPGIGPYTARALASLAFGRPVGVVDTNVRRWLLRRFAAPDAPRELQALADALAADGTRDEVAAWTHATMEFGAGVCRARGPLCSRCPIASGCPSRGRAARVPVPRQPPLAGTDRELRGEIVRRLSAAPSHALPESTLVTRVAVPADRGGRVIAGLERDGLVHRRGTSIHLGTARIGR